MKKQIFRNNRNENKYIEVVTYDAGHVYAVQFIGRKNDVANRTGDRCRHRFNKSTLASILEDYKEVLA